jgi:hypothetical protein
VTLFTAAAGSTRTVDLGTKHLGIEFLLSRINMDNKVAQFKYLWEDELADHVLVRVLKAGKLMFYVIERKSTATPLWIDDDKIHELVVTKLIEADISIIDRRVD